MKSLSTQELIMCDHIILGLTDKAIAQKLGISVSTVRTHLRQIRSKLGCQTRVEIAVWRVRNGAAA